jgi:hypothetical protein
MNKKKWMKFANKTTPASFDPRKNPLWISKLAEELGEVGRSLNEEGPEETLVELEHLKFIATQFQDAIRNHEED